MAFATSEQRRQLDTLGYVILPEFAPAALLGQLRERLQTLFAEEGEAAGSEFRKEAGAQRLANLVDKGEVFRRVIADPVVLEIASQVLGEDFKLSSLNARSANPFNHSSQPLHADGGGIADERGYWVCNAVWMIDEFTAENGAIRAVPGSHAWKQLPQQVLVDPAEVHPDEVLVTGSAGTVVVMNAHTWHGGTENRTTRPRCALHSFYCRRDKAQQQYQKKLLRPETQAVLSPQLRHLLAIDDPLNDALTAGSEGRSGFL
ncbi:MAG: phytanoyl-CoA dioxygenase family protein, partial [Armatimonadetes bacterium]|nr:phytanoyl-CoA dioxygenase family protein [Armatimonadota bacterium]